MSRHEARVFEFFANVQNPLLPFAEALGFVPTATDLLEKAFIIACETSSGPLYGNKRIKVEDHSKPGYMIRVSLDDTVLLFVSAWHNCAPVDIKEMEALPREKTFGAVSFDVFQRFAGDEMRNLFFFGQLIVRDVVAEHRRFFSHYDPYER